MVLGDSLSLATNVCFLCARAKESIDSALLEDVNLVLCGTRKMSDTWARQASYNLERVGHLFGKPWQV